MCTLETRGNIFLLTLTGSTTTTSDDQHRFSPTFITQLRSHLHQIRSTSKPGSVLITTGTGKFFSNGLDLSWAQSNGPSNYLPRLQQMGSDFKQLLTDLLTLPLPTIAAVNGHAAAAGFVFAITHDYVFMRRDRGVLYMSEIDIGMTFADYFMDLLLVKFHGSTKNLRDMVLGGMKIKGEEAVKRGIVDEAHDSVEETVEAAMRLGEKLGSRKWDGGVYCEIRKSVFKGVLPVLGLIEKEIVVARL
ncbi:hypothetical protein ACHQM5_018982 [Ranunculus cassubicifolius]